MYETALILIPELSAWNNGAGIDVTNWISAIGRHDYAVGYASLFWPDFFLYDACVLLRRPDPSEYRNWLSVCGDDRTKVEAVLNHRHIADLFLNSSEKPSPQMCGLLGTVMQQMWACKARRDFPERSIEIPLDSSDPEDLQITLFQKTASD